MNNKQFLLATLGLSTSCLIAGEDGIIHNTHSDSIEFCTSLRADSGSANFEIATRGNLYVIPTAVDDSHFTSIKYFDPRFVDPPRSPEFFKHTPSFGGSSAIGSLAFAGDTLIYADWINRESPEFDTVALQLYNVDDQSGDLSETIVFYMPTLTDRDNMGRPAISAEKDQFAVFGGTTGQDGHSRINIYRNTLSGWSLDQSIDSIPPTGTRSLAIEDDVLIIGYADETVHLYTRSEVEGWQFEQAIQPTQHPDISFANEFGNQISMHNNLIAVSAPSTITGVNGQCPIISGAVYTYTYGNGILTPSEVLFEQSVQCVASENFGATLDFSNDGSALLIGANGYDYLQNFTLIGAVFLYQTTDYSASAEVFYDGNLDTAGNQLSEAYGRSARFSGDSVTVFSVSHNEGNCPENTFYPALLIYNDVIPGVQPCSLADFNSDGVLSFFDISAFLEAFNASDMATDLNDDGLLNFFDITLFLQIFADGCP